MQTIKYDNIESIAFGILCAKGKTNSPLHILLERLELLIRDDHPIKDIRVYLQPVTKEANRYITSAAFGRELVQKYKTLKIIPLTDYDKYPTEPRAYNRLLVSMVEHKPTYLVFLHEDDVIINSKLLKYYHWLFATAHNPDLVGAVTFSDNVVYNKEEIYTKMWYADDVRLRGTCIKLQAALDTGLFDESLIYRTFEYDYFSRMLFHAFYLIRAGKEPNKFIQFGEPDVSEDHKKLAFVERQSKIWFAHKWHAGGFWKNLEQNCFIKQATFKTPQNVTFGTLIKPFIPTEASKKRRELRLEDIKADNVIMFSLAKLPSVIKKPPEKFFSRATSPFLPHNDKRIIERMHCTLEYHENLLWKPKKLY